MTGRTSHRAEQVDPDTWGILPEHLAAEAGLVREDDDDDEAPVVP